MTYPCEMIECIDNTGGMGLKMSILKCREPRAVQLVLNATRTVVWENRTITGTESMTLIRPDGSMAIWTVSVQETDNGIGFEVRDCLD